MPKWSKASSPATRSAPMPPAPAHRPIAEIRRDITRASGSALTALVAELEAALSAQKEA